MKPVRRVLEYLQIELSPDQSTSMDRYRAWLMDEAYPAGGIGPGEPDRIDSRHIADSLLFAGYLGESETVWDLGTGVGLPGIPMAILRPDIQFELIDRSGRRISLVKRAIRVLGLKNCTAVQADIHDLTGRVDALVARASLKPTGLAEVAARILAPGGVVIAGGSWVAKPDIVGWNAIEIPGDVLDHSIWLLMMRHQ